MEHRFLVNGALLGDKEGQPISIMVKIITINNNNEIIGETTGKNNLCFFQSCFQIYLNIPPSGLKKNITILNDIKQTQLFD